MAQLGNGDTGCFCWVDLAATDAGRAKAFYGNLFGWTSHEQSANGGRFTRLQLSNRDIGSVYQLRDVLLEHGIPSHWTPYVRVSDVNETVRRAVSLGGTIVAHPFVVTGIARIALILDSVGALIGLWEPIETNMKANGDG